MTSIFENTYSKVTVHILHDDTLTEDNRQRFILTAEKYSQEIDFIDITEHTQRLGDKLKKISEYWTVGTLYRIFVPEVMPSIEKVIYLDCDIIVNLYIKELWDIGLEGKSLAGVKDCICYMFSSYSSRAIQIKLIGGNIRSYINAGVSVMDLDKFRELGSFSSIAIDWMLRHAHLDLFPDQDALNAIFFNDIKYIDAKFNAYRLQDDTHNCIIHCYDSKPWGSFKGYESDRLYWKMFLRSAWGEGHAADDIIDKIAPLVQTSSGFHRSTMACVKYFLMRAQRYIHYRLPFRAMGLSSRIFFTGSNINFLPANNYNCKGRREGLNLLYGKIFCDCGGPSGIRTRVAALKGLCPWPLDDGTNHISGESRGT